MTYLSEVLNFNQANIIVEDGNKGKDLYMKGIMIQGNVKNANQRIYPVHEISNSVKTLEEQIRGDYTVLGEVDHPEDLKINLDRVSHMITEIWMDGNDGHGKLKILPTPMGEVMKTMLQNGVKLGVSSRGSGNVNESNGHVSEFEIVTVDIVAQPSAPSAYPKAIYESLMNMEYGHKVMEMAKESGHDRRVQKHVTKEVIRLINELKLL